MGRLKYKNEYMQQTKQMHNGMEEFAELHIPSKNNDRIVYLSGEVNEYSISNVISELLSMANDNPAKPIYLVISTYGGSIDEMFSLYDTIKFLPCPVFTIGLGKVMSAGVLLLCSGQKGKRMIGKNARVMIHPISSLLYGNIFSQLHEMKESQRLQTLLTDSLVKESKITKEELEKIMQSGYDYYLDPEKAVELGIADLIIGQ